VRAGGSRVVIAPSGRWGNGGTGEQRGPRGRSRPAPRLSQGCPTQHCWTHTIANTSSQRSPEPSGGILIKLKKLKIKNATNATGTGQGCTGSSPTGFVILPRSESRHGHTRGHTHVQTWPHACSRCPQRGMGSVLRRDSASRRWRGSELFLRRSSFPFRLRAALPSVIKIYQCEPKHLALHLLL